MTKLLSRKSIFQAKFFTVSEDELTLPTGSKRTYHNVKRDANVSVFPIDEDYTIYLIDQYRYLHQGRLIEAVAGMIEGEYTPLETAKKELKEEVGMKAETWTELATIKAAGSIITWDQILFLAKGLNFGEQELEESENIKLIKMSLDEAVGKVMQGEINTGSTVVGILMIDRLRQEGKL